MNRRNFFYKIMIFAYGEKELLAKEIKSKEPNTGFDLSKIDFLLTGEDSLILALGYDMGIDSSPRVLVKEKGVKAFIIKVTARFKNIPSYQETQLVRELYEHTLLTEMIPPDFFGAVAEIYAQHFRG